MEIGVRLGVDVGTVRIGVAATDPQGLLAFPVTTISQGEAAVAELAKIIAEKSAQTVYIGLPRTLKGTESSSAAMARLFANNLFAFLRDEGRELNPARIRLVDERFTSSQASSLLQQAGRNTKQQRQILDQAAAVLILEQALDIEKNGTTLQVTEEVTGEGA